MKLSWVVFVPRRDFSSDGQKKSDLPIVLHGRVIFRENKVLCAVKEDRNKEMYLSKKTYIIIDCGVVGRMNKIEPL